MAKPGGPYKKAEKVVAKTSAKSFNGTSGRKGKAEVHRTKKPQFNKKANKDKKEKKRKPIKPVALVEYDEEKRQDYITGFHKRKVAIKKGKIAKAVEFQKEEKREHRREKRGQLYQLKGMMQVIDAVGSKHSHVETVGKQKFNETITTVTVTAFEPDQAFDGFSSSDEDENEVRDEVSTNS